MNNNHSLNYFLSCDWGTSSFRLQLIDRCSGEILNGICSSVGFKRVGEGLIASKEKTKFCNPFQRYLTSPIGVLQKQFTKGLNDVPILISGMASSSIGWKQLPYEGLPFSLKNPDLHVKKIETKEEFLHQIFLIPGLCSSDDVMRGEETQMLGLAAQYDLYDGRCRCIVPGTHSKHMFIDDGQMTRFHTYMTGELFELLSTQSILENSLARPEKVFHQGGFLQGLEHYYQTSILQSLFSIRAGNLLHKTSHEKNYDLLSGLLIGAKLNKLGPYKGTCYLAGKQMLQQRYAVALKFLDIPFIQVKSPAALTGQGHNLILNHYIHTYGT